MSGPTGDRDDGGGGQAAWRPAEDPLVGLTDEARVAEAVADRARQRDLTLRAAELATLAGTLRDLAERGAGVGVATVSGRTYRGSATAVAADHLVLQTPAGQRVFVRLSAVAMVRPDRDSRAPLAQGDREPAQDLLLVERCARWVVDRPALALAVRGHDDLVRGRLLAVAEDLLSLSLDGARTPTYVAVDAVETIALEHRP